MGDSIDLNSAEAKETLQQLASKTLNEQFKNAYLDNTTKPAVYDPDPSYSVSGSMSIIPPGITKPEYSRLAPDWALENGALKHLECGEFVSSFGCIKCNEIVPEAVQKLALAKAQTNKVTI
jgi:hypothetical protein